MLQVHMKEVMSGVWLQGLDQSYLREQVRGFTQGGDICCLGVEPDLCPALSPWGSP